MIQGEKVRHQEKQYHPRCYICDMCKGSLQSMSFLVVFVVPWVRTRRSFNVYLTSITLGRRRVNVKTTVCVYWVVVSSTYFTPLYERTNPAGL